MNAMTMTADSLEGGLVARNALSSMLGAMFNAVQATTQAAMCSDCCGSNGNSCDPRDPTFPREEQ